MTDRVEQIVQKAKNHRVIALIVVASIAIAGVESTTSSITKLVESISLLTGFNETPELVQFAVATNTSAYRETEEPRFAAGPMIRSYMPDVNISEELPSYPVFQVSLENPSDKDILVTDIKYHVSDIGQVKGGSPGALESVYQYDYVLAYEEGTHIQKLVPPFKIPPKSVGAFELVLTTEEDDTGLIWIMTIEFVTTTGATSTDEFQLLLSGNPPWAREMRKSDNPR